MISLAKAVSDADATLIVVGDAKGPTAYDLPASQLLTLEAQRSGPFRLGRTAPVAHYARKNLGYLTAISAGAGCVYETDDDNAPLLCWAPRKREVHVATVAERGWANVYTCFTRIPIWPRGLPLEQIRRPPVNLPTIGDSPELVLVSSSIQQGLVNGSPDVDAIWRLLFDQPVTFGLGPSVSLSSGCFCPFNSQSTWWWPPAFPLMYLPSYCTFRMTDIWRSLIAQRCMWEIGEQVVFHPAEVVQERNEHRLLDDFRDEISGYLGNGMVAETLLATHLKRGREYVGDNLITCYESLVRSKHLDARELDLLRDWLRDLEGAVPKSSLPADPSPPSPATPRTVASAGRQ